MIKKIFFFLLFFSTQSLALELSGKFIQGGLIVGKSEKKEQVFVDGKKIKINKDGYFVFGIPRDRENSFVIISKINGKEKKIIKKIKKRKYKIQKISGLPKRKVTPSEKDMIRIKKESKLIALAKNKDTNLNFFFKEFLIPVKGVKTGVYGSQRILNGQPRRPHYGVDIAANRGTEIKSSNSGKIVLAEENFFFNGSTIIIDHGHGLVTVYSHLDKIFVKKNQLVNKGYVIGTVGSTGRASGPHLHFGMYCRNVPVDPDLVFSLN